MPKRVFKMDLGTIGHRPCEITLNQILIEQHNPRILRKVTRCLQDYKKYCERVEILFNSDPEYISFGINILLNWKEQQIKIVNSWQVPFCVKSHLICCLTAYHREAKNKITTTKPSTQ